MSGCKECHNDTQKKHERYYLEIFRDYYPDFPSGEIVESERPDFIVGNNTTGIEMVRIFQNQGAVSNQNHISDKDRKKKDPLAIDYNGDCIAYRIREKFIAAKLIPYLAAIGFSIQHVLRDAEIQQITDCLFDLMTKNLPSYGQEISKNHEDLQSLPTEISYFSILNIPKATMPCINQDKAGWSTENIIPYIDDVIKKKNKLLASYKPKCAEVWLLVYNEFLRAQSFFTPDKASLDHVFKTDFDKVLFLNGFDKKVYELTVREGVVR